MSNSLPYFLTYWRPLSSNPQKADLITSFLDYQKDKTLAKFAAGEVGKYIEKASSQINQALVQGFRAIDQRLFAIQMAQINTNVLLENIAELLQVPDSEKQRLRHIELGLKFFNQSHKDMSIAEDAKVEFEKALEIMPQDWFVLFQLGGFHLYKENFYDIDKAMDYFSRAAKYSIVQIDDEDSYVDSLFGKELDVKFDDQVDRKGLKIVCREIYLQLALCHYILAEDDFAVEYAKKAISVDQSPKAKALAIKYISRNPESSDEAINQAGKLLIDNPEFYEFLLSDIDIVSNKSVTYFLEEKAVDIDILIPEMINTINGLKEKYDLGTKLIEVQRDINIIKKEIEVIKSEQDQQKTSSFFSTEPAQLTNARNSLDHSISKMKRQEPLEKELKAYNSQYKEFQKLIKSIEEISLKSTKFQTYQEKVFFVNKSKKIIHECEKASPKQSSLQKYAPAIELAILSVAIWVAGIDSKIDDDELTAFERFCDNYSTSPVFGDYFRNSKTLIRNSIKMDEIQNYSKIITDGIATYQKLHGAIRLNDFKNSLLKLAEAIAEASGGSLFNRNKISKEEERVLIEIKAHLGL
ncbi:MAG: hypothetical protein NTW10_05445 [Bacteroidetes bacterium]|nr:hypothetical protein [Bacteroidota bacterium]